MSGSLLSGINYSVLFTGFATSDLASNLISTIYGGVTNTNSGADSLQALQTAQANQTADIAKEAKQPQISADIAAFTKALSTATTPAQLLQSPAALKVLLTANGLASQIPYTALAQKALLSDPKTSTSLVNQLNATNSNWLPTAETYQFFSKGLSVLKSPSTLSTLTSAYAEISWRQSLDATTPGLSNALTFLQTASTAKTAYDVLGNAVLRDVVTTALNIPLQIAFQPLEAQATAITSQLDLTRLKDPKFVKSMAQEYLLNKATAAQSTGTIASLDQLAIQASGILA